MTEKTDPSGGAMTDDIKPELPPLKPVAWFCAPFGTLKQNPLFCVEGPQSLNWALACYSEIQLSAAVSAAVAAETEALRGERGVLVRLLIECDKVLSTLEGESDEEERLIGCLRASIVHATTPLRPDEAGLLAIRATAPKGQTPNPNPNPNPKGQ